MGALLIAGNLMASCVAIMAAHCQSKGGAKHQATEDKRDRDRTIVGSCELRRPTR